MTGLPTTTPAENSVPVRLTADTTIGNVPMKAGATVAVAPDTADWLVQHGAAAIIREEQKEDGYRKK